MSSTMVLLLLLITFIQYIEVINAFSPNISGNLLIACKFPQQRRRVTTTETATFLHQLPQPVSDRRQFLDGIRGGAAAVLTSCLAVGVFPSLGINEAKARGLVLFPCNGPLENRYHFLRSGETRMEEEDIWSTNPLFLTNREAALSDKGVRQIQQSMQFLKDNQINPTVCRYSLAAGAMDTANLVSKELKIGRDRLVPEFNYMDPRAIGKWDMQQLSTTEYAVWAMDEDESGMDGKGGAPPPNEDSTPHETLHDQSIRLRQLLSVLESQYSGDTILLIFPDGTGPALLSAMMAGIPINRVHELEYAPGEVRLDVTMDTTLGLWQSRQQSKEWVESYDTILSNGRKELQRLRGMNDMVSIKDQRLENERIALDNQMQLNQATRLNKATAARAQAMQREPPLGENSRKLKASSTILDSRSLKKSLNQNKDYGPIEIFLGTLLLGGIGIMSTSQQDDVVGTSGIASSNMTILAADEVYLMTKPESTNQKPDAIENGTTSNRQSSKINPAVIVTPNVSPTAMSVQPPCLDPTTAVQDAMDKYMNSDDGGDAWLQMLGEMVQPEGEHSRLADQNEESAFQ